MLVAEHEDRLILDETNARRYAESMGFRFTGLIRLLVAAVRSGKLTKEGDRSAEPTGEGRLSDRFGSISVGIFVGRVLFALYKLFTSLVIRSVVVSMYSGYRSA